MSKQEFKKFKLNILILNIILTFTFIFLIISAININNLESRVKNNDLNIADAQFNYLNSQFMDLFDRLDKSSTDRILNFYSSPNSKDYKIYYDLFNNMDYINLYCESIGAGHGYITLGLTKHNTCHYGNDIWKDFKIEEYFIWLETHLGVTKND